LTGNIREYFGLDFVGLIRGYWRILWISILDTI